MHTIRVWDLPTRLFHWALVVCVIGQIVTANVGGNWMNWHLRLGYAVLTLLLFRLVWGFVGGHWSRFGSFLYAPSSVLAYLRGRPEPEHRVGHSPLGALSVFALLLILLAQGLFFTGFLILYIVSAKTAHRLVGYFEEEAVYSYSCYLAEIDSGAIENIAAPQVAIDYWQLAGDARLREVIIAVRADEAGHRDVNHDFANQLAASR